MPYFCYIFKYVILNEIIQSAKVATVTKLFTKGGFQANWQKLSPASIKKNSLFSYHFSFHGKTKQPGGKRKN